MMKIKISYFYQLRFFKPYQIPVSTAVWSPKWFMEHGISKDKNGVYNGICYRPLSPGFDAKCSKECHDDPETCSFIEGYRQQLAELNFSEVYSWLEQLAKNVQAKEGFEEDPEIILMVYETPDNKCSERRPIIEWFAQNGIDVQEYSK